MPRAAGSERYLPTTIRVAVDACVYAVVVTVLVTVGGLFVGVATGGGFVRGKLLLFLIGWLVLGYAVFQMWPRFPPDFDTTPTAESIPARHDRTAFQSLVQKSPPLRWMESPPPERRISVAGKLFLSGVLVLLVSFLMEAAFGVG